MSNLTSTPYDWIRQVPKELLEIDDIPLWGTPPAFPWDKFNAALSKSLQINSFGIALKNTSWLEPARLIDGIGQNPLISPFSLSPLKGLGYLILPHASAERLLKHFFDHDDIPLMDEAIINGFYRFINLEIANAFQQAEYDKTLSLQLLSEQPLPDAACLSIDLEFSILSEAYPARILITQEMRTSFKERYSQKSLNLPQTIFEKVEVIIELLAGSTSITKKEWLDTVPGDVILLDSCSLDPREDKGRVILAINGMPIFRGKIKDGNIKILEHPLFHEVQTVMNPKDFEDAEEHSDDESTEDSAFDTESDESFEDNLTEDEHESFEDEDLSEEGSEFDEEATEGDEEQEEEEEVKGKSALASTSPTGKAPVKGQDKASPALENDKKSIVKLEDIPVTIAVEVGRLQMTMQKLMELQPGNLLELNVRPENGVDLVVSGKCIAKGELLQIGDALGVRILDKI